MTREAIETLKENVCALCAYGSQNMNSCDIRGCDNRDAIEALKQEPVLDKIRAEIVDLGQRTMNDNRASGIWACRDIIDKYKAESEDT